jgi:hypothetical protein
MRNLQSGLITLVILGTILVSPKLCAAAGDTGSGAPASTLSNPAVGVWQGTTVAGCNVASSPDRCNAQQTITLTVIERENGKIAGSYRCHYGTQDCLRMSETARSFPPAWKEIGSQLERSPIRASAISLRGD